MSAAKKTPPAPPAIPSMRVPPLALAALSRERAKVARLEAQHAAAVAALRLSILDALAAAGAPSSYSIDESTGAIVPPSVAVSEAPGRR